MSKLITSASTIEHIHTLIKKYNKLKYELTYYDDIKYITAVTKIGGNFKDAYFDESVKTSIITAAKTRLSEILEEIHDYGIIDIDTSHYHSSLNSK